MAKRISKEARKKRTIRVVLIVIIVLAVLAAGIGLLRKQVTSSVNSGKDEVLSATVTKGGITTTVSGSGNLTDEDVEEILLHNDVEIDEIYVEAGDSVKKGDLLATVNMATVLSALADVQEQINDLDDEIGEASDGELDDTITSSIAGRVKKIYAETGDDVSTIMYKKGALALLSLDGYMAVEIETDALSAGDSVTVTDANSVTYTGTVETASSDSAVVLISDESAPYGGKVTVTNSEGTKLGTGKLYIHEEMKITGIAGTVSSVGVSTNQKISSGKTLFSLTDTSFSANYTSLLQERAELEEQLGRLITVYQDGAVLAQIDGTVSSVGNSSSSDSSAQSMYSSAMGEAQTSSSGGEQTLLSICPGTSMTVSISVDESDILSLEEGQAAVISVDALNDETVEGTVTDIDTTATSSGGVTVYTVTVSFDKSENMLSGMSASVAITIEGVEDALLIPSEALTQTSSTAYVYTSYDESTGELGGMVEVTSGMDNGSYVEITDGLDEGDTVYYFESEESGFSFGGRDFGNNMGGGMDFSSIIGGSSNMPDMGSMPGGSSSMPNRSGK